MSLNKRSIVKLGNKNPMFGKIPWNKGKKFPQFSTNNHPNWVGDKIGYIGIHIWLRKTFIRPLNCENCHKSNCRFEWALIKGKNYSRKRENFWNLCVSCHRNYDMDDNWKQNLSLSHKGLPFKTSNVQFI